MEPPHIDDATAEALLAGDPGGGEPELRAVLAELRSLAAGPAPTPNAELARLFDVGPGGTRLVAIEGGSRRPTRRRKGRVAAAASVAAFAGKIALAGAAAATVGGVTGVLPAHLQDAFATGVAWVTPFEAPRPDRVDTTPVHLDPPAATGVPPASLPAAEEPAATEPPPEAPPVDAAPADTAPGQSGATPGQSGATPGQSGAAPGQSDTAPGQSGTAPGQSGATPGQSGATPGQSGATPGSDGTAPGQSGATPGQDGSAPGQAQRERRAASVEPEPSLPPAGPPATLPEQAGSGPGHAHADVTTPHGPPPAGAANAPGRAGTTPALPPAAQAARAAAGEQP